MPSWMFDENIMPELAPKSAHNIDFSSVLAAAVHDMKNSLCLLLQSIETLSASIPDDDHSMSHQVADVHYEASRLNTSLVQILSLYRSQVSALPITVDEHFIADLCEDVCDAVKLSVRQRGFELEVHCDEELCWYLDGELIYMLVNDAVVNALRYGKQRIILSAWRDDDGLTIQVEDDGSGYPPSMLAQSQSDLASFAVSQGRTGLGLFFARLIAAAHTRDNRTGEIMLANGGQLGGSVFTVKIP